MLHHAHFVYTRGIIVSLTCLSLDCVQHYKNLFRDNGGDRIYDDPSLFYSRKRSRKLADIFQLVLEKSDVWKWTKLALKQD